MKYQVQENCLTIFLPSDVDHHNAEEIKKEADHLIDREHIRYIIFDFADTSFMDSSGIGVLLSRYKQMEGSRGTVRIYGAGPRITRILTIGGIMRLVKKCDTREEAIYG